LKAVSLAVVLARFAGVLIEGHFRSRFVMYVAGALHVLLLQKEAGGRTMKISKSVPPNGTVTESGRSLAGRFHFTY
jgi:hypothetical protein